MKDHTARRTRCARLAFADGISIEEAAFRRAINGGIRYAARGGIDAEMRDEIHFRVTELLLRKGAEGRLHDTNLSGMVFSAARNITLATFRAQARRTKTALEWSYENSAGERRTAADGYGAIVRREAQERLAQAFRQLSDADRRALVAWRRRIDAPHGAGPATSAEKKQAERARDRLRRGIREIEARSGGVEIA